MIKRTSAACFAQIWALGLGLMISVAAPAAAGPFPLISSQTVSAGSYDEALATARYGNNLFVVGTTSTAINGADIWISEWNATSMTLISSMTFNGSANGTDAAQGVAVDASGNVYVVGYASAPAGEQLWMGSFSPTLAINATATFNIPIMPESATGFVPAGIIVDSLGNIDIAGTTMVGSNAEIMLARFNSSLNLISSATYFSGNNGNSAYGIVQDSGGNFYVAGEVPHSSGSSGDIWVGKFNNAFGYVNSVTLNGAASQSDNANAIQIDPTNSYLFVSGGINNSVYEDLWLGKYDLSLNLLSSATVVAAADTGGQGFGLAVTSMNVILTGLVAPNAFIGQFDYNLRLLSSSTLSGAFNVGFGLSIDTAASDAWMVGYSTTPTYKTLLAKYALPPASGPPTSAITSPAAAYVNSLAVVAGTAQAYNGATVSNIAISARRLADNIYWNGASFASAIPVFLSGTFVGASSGTWSYISGSLGSALASGTSYQIQSQATDSYAQTQVAVSAIVFTYDTSIPTVGITSPISQAGDRESLASLAAIAGTAFDPVGGSLAVVQLRVRNETGPVYWNPVSNAFDIAAAASETAWFNAVSGSQYAAWTSTTNNLTPDFTGLDGSTFTVTARALNSAGTYSTAYASNTFVYSSSAPQTGVTTPANGAYVNTLTLSGTAVSLPLVNPGTVTAVQVRLKRLTDGYYWNSVSWTAGTATLGAAQGVSVFASSWSVSGADLPSGATLTSGASYYVTTSGTDNGSGGGNVEGFGGPHGSTFTFDNAPPSVFVSAPINGSSLTSFPTISGTAADAVSGVSVVQVSISSSPSYGSCWNGAAWVACPSYQSAAGAGVWWYSSGPSGGALTSGATYQIQAQATDLAGNISPLATSSFSYTNAISTGSGSGTIFAMTEGGGSLYAVGFTSNGASGNDIWVSRWDPASLTLISSATFNGSANGDDSATGIVRDPATGNLFVVGSASTTALGSFAWLGKFDSALNVISTITTNIPTIPGYVTTVPTNGTVLAPNGKLYVVNSVLIGGVFKIGLAEYDTSLNFISSTTYYNTFGVNWVFRVVADTSSNLYLSGGVSPSAGASTDMWIAKFTPNLSFVNAVTVAGPAGNSDNAWDLRLDPTNSFLFVSGALNNFGGITDLWLGKYDLNLNSLHSPYTLRGAGPGNSNGWSMVVTGTRIYMAGALSTSVSASSIFFGEFDYNLALLSSAGYHSSGSALDAGFGVVLDTPSASLIVGGVAIPAGTQIPWLHSFGIPGGAAYPGCAATENVGSTQAFTTIQSAVNALPNPLTGPSCVVIRDGATYPEQVTVQNFTMNGSSISIFADPASGLKPVVSPPAASTAAFVIANASVNVKGINIIPANAITYGVLISSTYVQLSGVNVQDASGNIGSAGIVTSSWTTVSFTSVTLGGANASGFWLPGSVKTTISFSTAATNTSPLVGPYGAALWLNGGSSNTITQCLIVNSTGGTGALLDTNANFNTISQSSMTGSYALYMTGVSSNTITQSFASDATEDAVVLDAFSSYNTISQSTVTSAGPGYSAIYFFGASFNTITQSYFSHPTGYGATLDTCDDNAITQSTITAGGGSNAALMLTSASSNTFSSDYVLGTGGADGMDLAAVSSGNRIFFSTIASPGTSNATLYVAASSSNTVFGSGLYVTGPGGEAAFFDQNSDSNTINASTISAPGNVSAGILFYSNTGNTLSQSFVSVPGANSSGVTFELAGSNAMTGTTILAGGSHSIGVYVQLDSGITLANCAVFASTPVFIAGSTATTISGSVLTASDPGGAGLFSAVGSIGLSLTSNVIAGGALGQGVFLNPGNGGALNFSANTIMGARYGVLITPQAPGAVLSIASMNFSGLAAGATAINFTGGTFVTTFTAVAFDSSVAVNVNAAALSGGSSITMAAPTGVKTGPVFSDDPSHYVHWPSTTPPTSAITSPVAGIVNSLPSISGTAQAYLGASVTSVGVSVQNLGTGFYWNGASSFSSPSQIFNPASLSTASAVWTYVNGALTPALATGSSYQIQSRATDSYLAAQSVPASFTVVVDSVPPSDSILIPVMGAVYASLPSISGAAGDNIAVATVTLSVQQIGGNCYNPAAAAFTAACPATFPAKGPSSAWTYPGIAWVNGQQYGLVATAVDLAGNVTVSSSVFTVFQSTGLTTGTPGDGQGVVTISPAGTAGCQLVTATATYTAGSSGIAVGGAIALHIPNGWTQPQGANPGPGYVQIFSTTGFTTEFNPAQVGNTTLGPNWIVYNATTTVTPGENIQFAYSGYPAQGSSAQGPQVFAFESQGAGNGKLVGLSSSPAVNVIPGVPALLSFSPSNPLTLGQFQNSPPMRLQLWDTCGVPTVQTGSPLAVALQASAGGATDSNAVFYSTPGAVVSSVSVPVGSGLSSAFYYNTSISGVSLENLTATASLAASTVSVSRAVNLLVSSASINLVSVDSGAPGSAQTTTITENAAAGASAFINFTLSNPSLNWEVIVSSDPLNFSPKLAGYSGTGNPGRTLTWGGVNHQTTPPQYLPPGTYYVEILAGGGSAVNTSLTVTIAPAPSIYGQVTNGPGAKVVAVGPNALSGNYAVASSTGFFQIFGLQSGTGYLIQASSTVMISSGVLNVTASATGVVATQAGTNAGNLTFQLPSLLEVSASLPFPAPADISGTISVHDSSFTHTGSGSIHFFQGGTASDNGAQAFGANASTWTGIPLPPGTYEVDIALPALRISTAVTGVVVNNGLPTFLQVALQKLVNVYGYAILPSVAAANTWVSVAAQSPSANVASVYGGVTIPVSASSAVYSLFGLASGAWTVTASAQGVLPASATVLISGTADVGTPGAGGLDLRLKAAGVLSGTLTVTGDTSQMNMSGSCPNGAALCVPVAGYGASNFFNGAVTVVLATSTTQTSGTFSFAGLPDGLYSISAALSGFTGQGQNVNVVSGAGAANLALTANGSKLLVTVALPAGVHPASDFKAVSLGCAGKLGASLAFPDMTAGTAIQYFSSSATVQLSGLNADIYQCQAFNAATGAYRSLSAPLASNTNAAVLLDLSGPTYAVGGSFSLGNNITLPSSSGLSVSVSSVPGLLANTGNLSYCLLGYATPPSISAAHLELLPAGPSGAFASGPLQTVGAGCSANLISPATSAGPTLPNPYLAYVAAIGANGSFAFTGVPPGVYLLRNNSQLDAAGDQIPQFSQTVVVTGTVAGLIFQAGSGGTLSGSVIAQPGVLLSRSMTVNLMNNAGQLTASAPVVFNNSNSAPFSFPQIVSGNYTLVLQDSSYPKAYAAAPLQVQSSGQNLSGLNLSVVPTGTIKCKVVIQATQPDGSLQSRLINPATVGLLPVSFKIQASANPWFSGGLGTAGGPSGGAPVLDSGNEFVVDGLLPGTYDVKLTAPGGNAGGVNVVDTMIPGVSVTAGNVTDIGFVNMGGGTQLSGIVADASKAPLANINVHAVPSQRGSGVASTAVDATTDGSGRYVLSGLDPKVRFYDVYAAYRGVEMQDESLLPYQPAMSSSVDLSTVSVLNFALAWAAYSVTGRVAAPAGGPALAVPTANGSTPGAMIYIQRSGVIPVNNPIADIQFQTDLNGAFTIPSLTSGTYRMTATSLGYASLSQLLTIANAPVNVGTLTMTQGATLTGALNNPDGSNPSQGQVGQILAVTQDLSNILVGALTTNPNTKSATGYTIAGFKTGLSYHVLLIDGQNGVVAPPEASAVVFASTGTTNLNIVCRPAAPVVAAKASRQNTGFQVEFDVSQPMREKTSSDDDLTSIVKPVSAAGVLSQLALSQDRTHLTGYYQPSVNESSFTFHMKGYSTSVDPGSTDPINPQFVADSTVTFFNGIDGLGQTNVANLQGGDVLVQGDKGRVTLPPGSFNVTVSSSVLITLQVAGEALGGGHGTSALGPAGRLASLRYGPQSYPSEILAAAAAVPPTVNPLSSFYNIFLPLGVSSALSKPAQLTVAYSTGTDPTTLNLYWYNPAANAYVLTQDVTGAPPVIDTINHTITLNVAHFSTYVLFNSAQAVITGGGGAGALQAGNFPNPFDLGAKLVTPLHAGAGSCSPNCTINGTMISVSVPPNLSGEATVQIFNVAGTRVRTVNFGSVQGGTFYYQNWDGTNDAGTAVASGVYIGELKVGSQTTFFKMAIIKGSGR